MHPLPQTFRSPADSVYLLPQSFRSPADSVYLLPQSFRNPVYQNPRSPICLCLYFPHYPARSGNPRLFPSDLPSLLTVLPLPLDPPGPQILLSLSTPVYMQDIHPHRSPQLLCWRLPEPYYTLHPHQQQPDP